MFFNQFNLKKNIPVYDQSKYILANLLIFGCRQVCFFLINLKKQIEN